MVPCVNMHAFMLTHYCTVCCVSTYIYICFSQPAHLGVLCGADLAGRLQGAPKDCHFVGLWPPACIADLWPRCVFLASTVFEGVKGPDLLRVNT